VWRSFTECPGGLPLHEPAAIDEFYSSKADVVRIEEIMTSNQRPNRRRVLRTIPTGAALGAAVGTGHAQTPAQGPAPATFVFVHAAWHGGWCWKKVTPLLRASGHDVHTPTLTGLGERAHLAHPMVGLETHVRDIVQFLECEDLRDVVLVGHSNAGTAITAIADRVPERLAHLVYLDAFVPADGQATIDLITFPRHAWETRVRTEGYGWLIPSLQPIPWDDFVRDVWRVTDEADRQWLVPRLRPTPFKTFTDPVRLTSGTASKVPRTYIRCLQHKSERFDGHADMARKTAGWRCRELAAAHEPFVTAPRELVDLLLETTSRAATV
jgi:pimeloyl-ACP methyl ester carboxylesterase